MMDNKVCSFFIGLTEKLLNIYKLICHHFLRDKKLLLFVIASIVHSKQRKQCL